MTVRTLEAGIAWGRTKEGQHESPPGSNHMWVWSDYQHLYGRNFQGNPWCGAWVLDVCYHAGWKGPSSFISVEEIETWGRSHHRWHNGAHGIHAGCIAVLFGHGKHTEFACSSLSGGYYWSLGGNTSEKSQWNGGEIRYQQRANHDVIGYVDVANLFPKPVKPKPKHAPAPTTRHSAYTIKQVQARLNKVGGVNGKGAKPVLKVDGVKGPKTLSAIKVFQYVHGINNDGVLNAKTLNALF